MLDCADDYSFHATLPFFLRGCLMRTCTIAPGLWSRPTFYHALLVVTPDSRRDVSITALAGTGCNQSCGFFNTFFGTCLFYLGWDFLHPPCFPGARPFVLRGACSAKSPFLNIFCYCAAPCPCCYCTALVHPFDVIEWCRTPFYGYDCALLVGLYGVRDRAYALIST